MRIWLTCIAITLSSYALAQETDTTVVEEDFSMYADAELAAGAKRFCTSKVFDLSPNKLISIGYDFQGSHTMSLASIGNTPASDFSVNSVQSLRVSANVPIVSKTNLLINLGVNYWEANYSIQNAESHPLANVLQESGLRTTGLMATLFKPLNEKNFLLFQVSADLSGDYFFPNFQPISQLRYSGTVIYGWKKHDRLMYGFGASRTYRVGEPNYIPVFLYNYTFPSRKWGVESVFPARAQIRRTFNTRTLAFFGYELEGQSYFISALQNDSDLTNPQLRRSELRIRFTFERSLKDFLWVSAQAGLRYNWSYNLDDGDFFRGFTGTQDYVMENTLSNAFYFNLSINLVSP
jgi:Domain of unknown function (DUF6268)